MFSKQAANSLVTETSQYFVFFCRSVCSANLAKCLIINVLRLIIVILFFIAFLNITYVARHTYASVVTLSQGVPLDTVRELMGHRDWRATRIYAHLTHDKVSEDMGRLQKRLDDKFDYNPLAEDATFQTATSKTKAGHNKRMKP